MSVRHRISQWLAAPLRRVHQRRLSQGEYGLIPNPIWSALPDRVRTWCSYSVFGPNEDFARELVRQHEVLGRFISGNESSWTLSPATLLYLWRQLIKRRPGCIVEFGSGLSSLVFASFAQFAEKSGVVVSVISIDHDAEWLENTRERLARHGVLNYVRLVHAPIADQEILGRVRPAYQVPPDVLQSVANRGGIDFCLIDGPPSQIGRSGCLPIVQPFLAPNAILLLDDAFRTGEQAAWREWTSRWSQSMRRTRLVPTYHRGLAVAEWRAC